MGLGNDSSTDKEQRLKATIGFELRTAVLEVWILGVPLVGSWDFNFLGFYINYNKEAKSLTFRGGVRSRPRILSKAPRALI